MSGPRVDEKGEGFERLRAVFAIGSSQITLRYKIHIDVIEPWLYFESPSPVSFRMLSYYDFDIFGAGNDVILNYATRNKYTTETRIGDVELLVKDDGRAFPSIHINPYIADSPRQWLLRYPCSYTTTNPDNCLNGANIDRKDIVIWYEASRTSTTFALPGPWLYLESA